MDYSRYLASKRTVDDRALNRDVLRTFITSLHGREELKILEVGAGIGAMLERLLRTNAFTQ